MKIDIHQPPPSDIFKDKKKYTIFFVILVAIGCSGLLLGAYAIFFDTIYYSKIETLALALFAGPAFFVSFVGEKLQTYKKLTPPQHKELAELSQNHAEIQTYCNLILQQDREPIRLEFETCQAWAEEKERKNKDK